MRMATAGYAIGKIAREGAQRDLKAVRTEYAASVRKAQAKQASSKMSKPAAAERRKSPPSPKG